MQSFAKSALFILGCLSFLIATVVALIVLHMVQHPRGVGMERLAGPLFGLVGMAFITVGVFAMRIALELKKKRPGIRGAGYGSEVSGQTPGRTEAVTL